MTRVDGFRLRPFSENLPALFEDGAIAELNVPLL
jgi:hypothetical protein